MQATASATINHERILSVDVLRGFALFGILYSHMIFWYAAGALPNSYYQTNYGIASIVASVSYFLFFMGKFFSIFSFLFGLSFYIQLKALSKYTENPAARFAWRLSILGIIALAHHTFWRADILSIYVPLGFLLIFFRQLSDKALLIIGSVLVLNLPTILLQFVSLAIHNTSNLMPSNHDAEVTLYYHVISQANFWEMCRGNLLGTYDKIVYQINSGRLLITFGFFLLGMWVGRLGWFNNLHESKPYFQSIWSKSWKILILSLLVMFALGIYVKVAGFDMQKNEWAQFPFGVIFNVINTCLTLFYISSVSLLMTNEKWSNRFAPLASIGKMALTTYIMQSVIGVFLFFHIGLGLFGKTTPAQNVGMCILIFAVQILFCRWWLSRFNYGPIEWLWRSATFLKWQPFIKR